MKDSTETGGIIALGLSGWLVLPGMSVVCREEVASHLPPCLAVCHVNEEAVASLRDSGLRRNTR